MEEGGGNSFESFLQASEADDVTKNCLILSWYSSLNRFFQCWSQIPSETYCRKRRIKKMLITSGVCEIFLFYPTSVNIDFLLRGLRLHSRSVIGSALKMACTEMIASHLTVSGAQKTSVKSKQNVYRPYDGILALSARLKMMTLVRVCNNFRSYTLSPHQS